MNNLSSASPVSGHGTGDSLSANALIADMARLLEVNIDEATLHSCIKLLDQGVDPKQLANSITRINNETKSVYS